MRVALLNTSEDRQFNTDWGRYSGYFDDTSTFAVDRESNSGIPVNEVGS